MKYRIQIFDVQSNRIEYFDRIKTSYGGHRIITSQDKGRVYFSIESAETDKLIVAKYFLGQHFLEIVEYKEDESPGMDHTKCIDF